MFFYINFDLSNQITVSAIERIVFYPHLSSGIRQYYFVKWKWWSNYKSPGTHY